MVVTTTELGEKCMTELANPVVTTIKHLNLKKASIEELEEK